MLVLKYKCTFFNMDRIWKFDSEILPKVKADVYRLLRCYDMPVLDGQKMILCDCVETLLHDLTNDEVTLLSSFKKSTVYEVKRAQKEGNLLNYYPVNIIKSDERIIEDFFAVYTHFCLESGQPKLVKDLKKSVINSYIENNCFLLSCVKFDKGKAYHAYVFDNEHAVLVYSASDFRNNGVNRQVAGRANKMLHYEDMCYFKKMGLKVYDWGNISSSQKPNGIDKFKMSFGGTLQEVYNIYFGNSLIGCMLIKIKGFIDNVMKGQ